MVSVYGLTEIGRDGKEKGFYPQQRDMDFIQMCARWWCISPNHFVRATNPVEDWWDVYTSNHDSAWRLKNYESIKRRANRMTRLKEAPLSMGYGSDYLAAYWCTRVGGEYVQAPWDSYIAGNVMRSKHSFAATDVGLGIERLGFQVYSEREFATGATVENETLHGGKFVYPDDRGFGPRPDLAIPLSDGRFIFVEVERALGAKVSKYEQKLKWYYGHERIAAVWYMVENQPVGERIRDVVKYTSLGNRKMPVNLFMMNHGFQYFTWVPSFSGGKPTEQLASLGALTL